VFAALSTFALMLLLILGVVRSLGEVTRRFRMNAVQPNGPPAYELVKRIERADAARALEILRGDHGLFRFDEMKWYGPTEDPYEDEGYWSPTMSSGLYDSADAAERDARAEIPWLREMVGA
jgi:hypothetical protein